MAGDTLPCGENSISRKLPRMKICSSRFSGVLGAVLAVATLSVGGCRIANQSGPAAHVPKLVRAIELPGLTQTRTNVGVPGRIDHLAYDPAAERLFVCALENGSLEVVDLKSGQRVRSIPGLNRPQGAAVMLVAGSVAVASGGDGLVRVFDTRSLDLRREFELGEDADNVRFDAAANTILVTYGDTNRGAIAVFDAANWTKLREISFPSRPESFQLDPHGNRLFANLPKGVRAVEDGKVAVADRHTGETLATIPLAGLARNFPMAFDATNERLFIACRRPARLVVIDTRRNSVIAETPCTDDSDDLFYDATNRRVLVIGGGFRPDLQTPAERSPCSPPGEMGGLDVFSVGLNGQLTRLKTIPTAPHARTGLLVPARRALYVVVARRPGHEAEVLEYKLD